MWTIPGVIAKGKLLTLTTQEALKHGLADARADTLDAVLASLDLAGAEVRRATQTWAETLVRFLTHPVVSSLLMTIGILGIIVEIRTPGFGVPGSLGVASLALFFWGHWLVRLAGWEELLLLGIGVILLAIEIFVTPGFGLIGVLGLAALIGGLGLSLVGRGGDVGGCGHRRRAGRGLTPAGPRGVPGLVACSPAPPVRPPAGPRRPS